MLGIVWNLGKQSNEEQIPRWIWKENIESAYVFQSFGLSLV